MHALSHVYLSIPTPLTRSTARQILKARVPGLRAKSKPRSKPAGAASPAADASTVSNYAFGGEFEERLRFALGLHVVAPLLHAVSDVADLERLMHSYLKLNPTVKSTPDHIFHETTSGEREQLEALIERLESVRDGLTAMAPPS